MSDAPWADLVAVNGTTAVIACPYCGRHHTHQITTRGRAERRAPACGLYRSADDRAAGYRFHTERKERP